MQGTEIISYLTITVVRFLYIMLSYWGARSPFWRLPISTTNIATTLDILLPSIYSHKLQLTNSDSVSGYKCVSEKDLFVAGFQSISNEITMT